MSGIGVIFHRDGRPVSSEDLERLAEGLDRFGPDYRTTRVTGCVGFAYACLATTPESRSSPQPIEGTRSQFVMLFDGRLDNRAELLASLGLFGGSDRPLADAEIALRAYERWGAECFEHWIGEFAVICWDAKERRLLAARDPLGYRTLHYFLEPHRLVIASAPKGLLALPGVPRDIDQVKIADALCGLYADGERTYFKGIRRIAAGDLLVADAASARSRTYYRLEERVRPIRYKRDDDYVDAARELLERSLAARLRCDGPIGAFMSGGLDSSTLCIMASRSLGAQGKRLSTFTWVPEKGWDGRTGYRKYGDETAYVSAIAEAHPDIEINFLAAEGRGMYDRQDDLLDVADMPFRNAGNFCWLHAILEEARDRGVKVMLDGGLGNPTLSYGGGDVLAEHWRSRRFRRLLAEMAHTGGSGLVGFARTFLSSIVFPMGPEWLWNLKERLRGRDAGSDLWLRFSALDPEFGTSIDFPARAARFGFRFHGSKPAPKREQMRWLLTRYVATEMGDIKRSMEALYGIESRDPYSDRRLVEWCLGVPEEQFCRDGEQRWLMKRLATGLLPHGVLHKPETIGLQTSDWHLRMTRDLPSMRSQLHEFAQDPCISEMIDLPRLQRLLDDWPNETVIDDDRQFYLPVIVPLALQVGRFMQRANLRRDEGASATT
ncbi:MAG: asparagine synthase-related protein [Hyphomicrobiaceae bacterium]